MNQLKLHVGCASKRLDGYINIDSRQTEATDHVCDAGAIRIAAPGSVAEIYSRHMLEHLDPNDALATLTHWHALLAPAGMLHVIVPDITFHARQLLGLERSSWRTRTCMHSPGSGVGATRHAEAVGKMRIVGATPSNL